ncbi:glycosyltransferase family 39 protein [Pengzhenrongella phosphoraccumulans]|uniref:glycosyltransferase family 39 protein n=1 Tax=Pengzhenrongella phosphoraccumulans TaxID=3114394 RepID=UPI00388F36F3
MTTQLPLARALPETPGVPQAQAAGGSTPVAPVGPLAPVARRDEPPACVARTRWERPALLALLVATAALYLWDLSASGWANSFYSAAAQAGSQSWTAFLFGASDAAASITVDKPPASLWVMGLSVRIFGLSSWSILVPQALMGVATVAVLYASVRRRFTPQAALLAGAVLALTPVAALMFRFNNPDALLVLLLTLAAWATLRAVEDGRTRWMLLAGALVGLGFLTKQLQAFLVLPGFAIAYLIAAPVPLARRIRDGLGAMGAMVLAAGWWVALVELWPESSRPYIGGSQTNSFLELTFGYNGLGRLTGDETGSVGGGTGQTGGWGSTGIGRLFGGEIGGQIAWLIPAALVFAVVGLWLRRRAPRTDSPRAALIVWGSWLVVTAVTFSMMAGIFHAYYTVALAPAIAALVGIGTSLVWARRRELWALLVLASVTVLTSGLAFVLLGRSAEWLPWLRWVVLLAGLGGALGLVSGRWLGSRMVRVSAVLALVASLAGPAAYTVQTVLDAHTGSIVTAGPTVTGGMGGMGGMGGGPGGFIGAPGGRAAGAGGGPGGQPPTGSTPPGGAAGTGGMTLGGTTTLGGATAGANGGMGSLLNGSQVGAEVTALLLEDADAYTWVAATVGANSAAGYQLATEESVMPIGGFNGSDPSPTLAQFQADVAAGLIHYFIGGSSMGPGAGGSGSSSEIAAWVAATFTADDVAGVTLYDLTAPAASTS